MINNIKLILAALIAVAGLYGYYALPELLGPDASILWRAGLVLVTLLIAAALVARSETGLAFIEFAKGSRTELRKMVWPSGSEARQMTLIVLVAVILVALFLWLIDAIVFQIVYDWLLGVES